VWAVGQGRSEVLRFPVSTLSGRVSATPDLTLGSDALHHPRNLAFDRDGNLWVANRKDGTSSPDDEGTILRFDDPRRLTGTQRVSPALRISSGASAPGSGPIDLVGAIAFDPAGSLWATSNRRDRAVRRCARPPRRRPADACGDHR
jgi:glucose/arabinose dehydrogenase